MRDIVELSWVVVPHILSALFKRVISLFEFHLSIKETYLGNLIRLMLYRQYLIVDNIEDIWIIEHFTINQIVYAAYVYKNLK